MQVTINSEQLYAELDTLASFTDASPPGVTRVVFSKVDHAGPYDCTVGVLGGLVAIRALQRAGFQPRRSIELLMFTSEEPTRFGIGCLGSRLLSGSLNPGRAKTLTDSDVQSLDQVRIAAGFTGELDDVLLSRGYYEAFLELHVEQGSSPRGAEHSCRCCDCHCCSRKLANLA